jgi:hypothetical protein
MLKKTGLLALILMARTMILPSAAFAQNPYYEGGSYSYYGDRNWDRHERGEWRGRERRERPAEEWRESRRREREWREHEWRERERWEHQFERDYSPGRYFYFGYGR